MITNGKYILRKGRKGDRPYTMYAQAGENIPDYVLLMAKQIGTLHGQINAVRFIEIFNGHKNKGHGTKFVELIEIAAKNAGHKQLVFYPVTSEVLAHILQSRGYILNVVERGDKTYIKNLTIDNR